MNLADEDIKRFALTNLVFKPFKASFEWVVGQIGGIHYSCKACRNEYLNFRRVGMLWFYSSIARECLYHNTLSILYCLTHHKNQVEIFNQFWLLEILRSWLRRRLKWWCVNSAQKHMIEGKRCNTTIPIISRYGRTQLR